MKKPNRLIWILGVLAVLILIGMAPISSNADTSNDNQTNDQTEASPSKEKTESAKVCVETDENTKANYENASDKSSVNIQKANELIKRWLSCEQVEQFELKAMDASEDDQETFKISSGSDNHIIVEATSTSALLMGWNWYMKYEANANTSFNGKNINLSKQLPQPDQEIERHSSVENRFALNDTDEGYNDPYADWEDWQRKIDVLAMHGINEVLVYPGQEAVYQKTFQDFGYSKSEMLNWIPGPAHQPWWLMQNLSTFPRSMPQEAIDKRVELGEKIADRLRDLGMTPVFPGYYGMVPFDFEEKNADADIVSQGTYHTFQQPDWLDTTTDLYSKIAAKFYEHQSNLFGDTDMYKMDLFHEGGKEGDVNVGEASKAVQEALNTAHPDAIWALLGWHSNPLKETIDAVDKEKTLVLDGISDRSSAKDREDDWDQTPYAFGTIWNFGGHSNMGANVTVWNEKFYEWQDKQDSALSGVALMPEAINNNPFAVEFFTELPWHEESLDMDKWVEDYAKARYGASDSDAIEAWKAIQKTAYDLPANNDSQRTTDIFSVEPSLNFDFPYWKKDLNYSKSEFEQSLTGLLNVDPELRDSSAYQYDLMDVTRTVIANRGRTLLPEIKKAYEENDKDEFDKLSEQFLHYIDLTEQVTATNKHSMLGPWLEKAENFINDDSGSEQLVYDAKSLISIWSPQNSLNDYGRRQWSGLTGDYYYSRWETYFEKLDAALETKTKPESIDWYEFGEDWVDQSDDFPTETKGNIFEIANEVHDELANQTLGDLDVTSDERVLNNDNKETTVKASFTNKNGLNEARDVELTIDVPEGYTAEPQGATSDNVGVNDDFTVEWNVTAPDNLSKAATETFTINAHYEIEGETKEISETILELVENEVQSPLKTVSLNNSTFSQSESGDELAIYGSGEDWWKSTDEYGAIYKEDAFESSDTATAKVEHQDNTWGYARAGLVARNDLTGKGDSAGYLNISVTPENGCILSWDSNGNGKLNKNKGSTDVSAPAYVKLSRDGTTFTGACSKDGENWTEVGTVEVPEAESSQDIGLAMSSVNRHSEELGIADFSEFKIEPQVFSLNLAHNKIPKDIPVKINAVFENVLDQTIENMDASLDVPDDFEVKEIASIEKSEIAPGEKVEQTWEVVATDDVDFSRYNLRASANYEVSGEKRDTGDTLPVELVSTTNHLAEAFNNVGITDDDNPSPGNLDGKMSFSAQSLAEKGFKPGATVTHDGMAFEWPDVSAEAPDNVAGQAAIRTDVKGDKLSFIGTAVGTSSSDQSGTGSIVYSDGDVENFIIELDNYYAKHDPSKNSVVAVDGRNRPSGPVNHEYKYQFLYDSVPLNPDKKVKAVILPDKSSMHIFSMTTTKIGIDDLEEQIQSLRDQGEIKNDAAAHDLKRHLTAVKHYEDTEADKKVIKHLKGFKNLLKNQNNKDLISDKAFDKLSTDTDYLIEK